MGIGRRSAARAAGVGVLLTSFVMAGGAAATASGPAGGRSSSPAPQVSTDVHHDTSPPLRTIPAAPRRTTHTVREHHDLSPAGATSGQPDGALQATTTSSVSAATTAGLSFPGVGNGDYGFTPNAAPPDTEGAVGATQYVQWVNESFAVFNKATGALQAGPEAGNTLWAGFGGGCQNNNDGDPIVQYDKVQQRWIFTQFSVSTTPYLQCVAVSTTSDATGSYNRYSFSEPNFPDYPKLGVWPDAYYISFNMFNGNTFLGARACSFDKSAMMAGNVATQICFQEANTVPSLLPSDLDGTIAPPSGAPNVYVNFGANSLNIYRFHSDFATPANATFTGPVNLPVDAFSEACGGGTCIPQSGTRQTLDSLGDRLMYRLAYRHFSDGHEAWVVNHSVAVGTTTGVRWYELRGLSSTPSVFQQGTFAPDSNYRWMGSAAMDQSGDIAVGYSKSSSSMFPSIAIAGRVPTDPAGTLEAENVVKSGTGSQSGFSLNRWGDYSAMSVDPVDDCTFFYTNEYEKATGAFNWSTWINSFKFSNCGGPATPDFTVSASPTTLTASQGSSPTSTITVGSVNGFNSAVSLSAAVSPSSQGVTATIPSSVTPPANNSTNATLTVSASSTATPGNYTVTVTGTSGTLSHQTTVTVTVPSPPTPDFSISASPSAVTISRGGSTTSTITVTPMSGFAGTVTLTSSTSSGKATLSPLSITVSSGGSGTSTLTITAPSSLGNYTVTVTGTSGALTHSATVTVHVSKH